MNGLILYPTVTEAGQESNLVGHSYPGFKKVLQNSKIRGTMFNFPGASGKSRF